MNGLIYRKVSPITANALLDFCEELRIDGPSIWNPFESMVLGVEDPEVGLTEEIWNKWHAAGVIAA